MHNKDETLIKTSKPLNLCSSTPTPISFIPDYHAKKRESKGMNKKAKAPIKA